MAVVFLPAEHGSYRTWWWVKGRDLSGDAPQDTVAAWGTQRPRNQHGGRLLPRHKPDRAKVMHSAAGWDVNGP